MYSCIKYDCKINLKTNKWLCHWNNEKNIVQQSYLIILGETTFKTGNFRSIFVGFFKHFFVIMRNYNFAVQPKYYISWHFDFAVWPKYYNLRNFSFVEVLKIFHMREFPTFQECRVKARNLNASLKAFLCFLHTPLISKCITNTRKTSWFKNIVVCII